MNEAAQHGLATWVPADVLVGCVVLLVGVIFLMARSQWTKQTRATEQLAAAVNKLAMRADDTVSREQHNALAQSMREAHSALSERVSVLYDRADRK